MSCIKCQTLPSIENKQGTLLASFTVSELADKMIHYLDQHKIAYEVEDAQTLWIKVDGFLDLFEELCHSHFLTKMEREAVNLLFLENGENFTPSKISRMKNLQQYKDLIGAKKLKEIIALGTLTTHFQPIVDIKNNQIYGYESLARAVDEDGSLIYPDNLFKWAKEGDMMFFLDRACRETSLKTAAVKNIRSKLFINFIPTAIYDPAHCLQSTVQWAKQLNFDPKNVIFEVTETEQVEDLEHLKTILDYYKSKGFMVALDDVGSGYSSLNMISKLLPHIVKVDRATIDYIDTNVANQSIFRAIVQIARENNIMVLAEGIERVEELEFCAREGADLAQGYYFGRPVAEPKRKL